jgi:hypothetical protein
MGPSDLHAGYVRWGITGSTQNGDLYVLHIPRVLPARGGFFDGLLEVNFAGGTNGSLQLQLPDCVVG